MDSKTQRRNFLKNTGAFSLGLLFLGIGDELSATEIFSGKIDFDNGVIDFSKIDENIKSKPLGKNKTLLALIETIVPGKTTDPDNEPGALEAGAVDLLEENHFDIKRYIPYVTFGLNSAAKMRHCKKFEKLDREQRESILRNMELKLPYITLFIRYIKIPFFGGDYNRIGLDYFSYPGPNDGYHHDETRSFVEPIGVELTEKGYMP